MKKEFMLTVILNEEAKNYLLPKEKAEHLLSLIISHNVENIKKEKERKDLIKLIQSSSITSVERFENQIVIKLA